MPVKLAMTEGTFADCSQGLPLIEGITAECLLVDKAYDTNEIIAGTKALGMNPLIPPKSNRREPWDYDRALYQLRHLVENGFLGLQAVAGSGNPVRQKSGFIPGHLPTPGRDDLEQAVLTTPPRNMEQAAMSGEVSVNDIVEARGRPGYQHGLISSPGQSGIPCRAWGVTTLSSNNPLGRCAHNGEEPPPVQSRAKTRTIPNSSSTTIASAAGCRWRVREDLVQGQGASR